MSNGGVGEPSPGGGFTPPASPAIDANEYARMQQQLHELQKDNQDMQSVFDQLAPHSARIKRMVEDESAAMGIGIVWADMGCDRRLRRPVLCEASFRR